MAQWRLATTGAQGLRGRWPSLLGSRLAMASEPAGPSRPAPRPPGGTLGPPGGRQCFCSPSRSLMFSMAWGKPRSAALRHHPMAWAASRSTPLPSM